MHLGRLLLRATVGSVFVVHGTQKLFGWFGGRGPDGTGQFFESLGLRPGRAQALLAVAAVALVEEGPGRLSLDAVLGQERNGPLWALGALGAGALGSQLAITAGRRQNPPGVEEPAAATPAAGAPTDGAGAGATT